MKKCITLFLALILVFALAACGNLLPVPGMDGSGFSGSSGGADSGDGPSLFGGSGSEASRSSSPVGTWELTRRTQDGVDSPYENPVYLALEHGGTGYASDNGEEEELTWDETSITLYGETVYYRISGDTLTFSVDNMFFTFTRISYEPSPRQSGQDAEIEEDDPSLEMAPDFQLKDRDGNTYSLSDFRGKPVIINFWATWCGPCQAELPYFNEAYTEYGDRIQFLMVDLVDGSYETESGTIDFVDSNGYRFPLFFDCDSQGMNAYEITAIPMTVIINSHGRIVDTHVGSMSRAELQELIDKLL